MPEETQTEKDAESRPAKAANVVTGLSVFVLGLAGAVLSFLAFSDFRTVPIGSIDLADVPRALSVLIFFALVLERATEVYVNAIIEPKRALGQSRIKVARDNFERVKNQLDSARKVPKEHLSSDALSALESSVSQATERLSKAETDQQGEEASLSAETHQRTSVILTVLGVGTAITGVRVIAPFLDPGTEPSVTGLPGWQPQLLTGVDVFVTAGLLAGGATGIHRILTSFARMSRD